MRYSANLNVILKAVEKATSRMSRDFIELENLQSNPMSAQKFASACYVRVKQVLVEEFSKLRPEYNIIFSDGEKVINSQNAEYSYIIHPIDGFANLTRSSSDFAVAVALEHKNPAGQKEAISVAIAKVFGGETYYCEKGFGAYVNNRRIRVSKRTSGEMLTAAEDHTFVTDKNVSLRAYGCRTLEMAYVDCSRLEKAIFKNQNYELFRPFMLLVKEAGGKVVEDDNKITVSA